MPTSPPGRGWSGTNPEPAGQKETGKADAFPVCLCTERGDSITLPAAGALMRTFVRTLMRPGLGGVALGARGLEGFLPCLARLIAALVGLPGILGAGAFLFPFLALAGFARLFVIALLAHVAREAFAVADFLEAAQCLVDRLVVLEFQTDQPDHPLPLWFLRKPSL